MSQISAIQGCIMGTAIGDSMGLPYEGLSKRRVAGFYRPKQSLLMSRGMLSDDTEHTIIVCQALIQSQGDPVRFQQYLGTALKYWLWRLPAGIGWATLRALLKLSVGYSVNNSGVFSAGNGPAMRSALIGVAYGAQPGLCFQLVKHTTRITHTDPKAFWGAYCVATAAYLASQHNLTEDALLTQLKTSLPNTTESLTFIAMIAQAASSARARQSTPDFASDHGYPKGITGYVYSTVPIAIQACLRHSESFSAAIEATILCGGDTDTAAAIVGGILGAQSGIDGIPENWLVGLTDWPMHKSFLMRCGQQLNDMLHEQKPLPAIPISTLALFLRNSLFTVIVLAHGLRRLLPPY